MSANVHLLSMSATPIPRSLNMALSKIKGYSELRTPPVERKGVRTFVKSFDETVVKEAIMRELRRGGQIFYVYNSIAGIESKKEELLEILPDLRILILHSKITAVQTEKEIFKTEKITNDPRYLLPTKRIPENQYGDSIPALAPGPTANISVAARLGNQ
jgi:transcription-repair coupling factor (superfamily II helicase)